MEMRLGAEGPVSADHYTELKCLPNWIFKHRIRIGYSGHDSMHMDGNRNPLHIMSSKNKCYAN